ncbi:MAG: hypothetical protein ACI4VH_05670 [Clostridia bacterium]
MAELKIDIDGINNKVIPLLNKAKTELESAASSLSAISYSPDYYKFTNRSRVQSVLPQNIRNIKTNVNNINKWLGEIENRFKNADKKSNTAVNSLVSQMENIDLSLSISKTGGNVKTVTNSAKKTSNNKNTNPFEEGWNNVGAWISNGWNGICSFAEQSWNNVCATVSNGWNSICSFGEEIWNGVSSFAQEAWNTITSMASEVEKAINSVGAHISSAWNSFCTEVWPNIWDGIQSTAASVSNVVIGFVKGLGQFIESLVDLVVILGTAIGSIGTGIYDGISYLVSLANGTSDEWESVTGAMWGNVMGFVAEDHVGNAFADFYKNNVVGQWLDEHAIDVCKSDGIVTNVASGLGYVAGIIALTVGTLGIGTAVSAGATTMSFATTSAVVAAAAGTGKYTQESWGKMRDSSWEGIERMHEKGEITEEQYESYIMVRNLTDEQWAEIEEEYKSGAISEEEYEAMKQIREIPEDWKTFENGAKGLFYGVANGVWEGVQWYVGGKLAGWAVKGHQVATSSVRVGADTAFNGLDTPFRTAMDTITYGRTWDQAWEEQGGWQSLLTNIGIGLVGSAGGEIFDGVKLNKASKVLDQSQIFDDLDEMSAKELKEALLQDQQAGKINLSKMTQEELENEVLNKISSINEEIDNIFAKEIKQVTRKISNRKLYNDVDESLVNQVKSNLMNKHINKEIDLSTMSKKEIQNQITAEVSNIKNTLNSIIKNSNFNKTNLIEGIVDTIPKELDDLTKARMVYLKLNQSVTYSDQYFAMNTAKNLYQDELSEMYNRNFDISNLSTNSIICSNWSNIYADLLQEVGINPKKIEIIQSGNAVGSHRWVKMELDDGKILYADATNNINGMTDLANSKLGNSTGGFIITTSEEYAKLRKIYGDSDAQTFKAINSNKNPTISKIDENIGYSNQQYMKDFEDIIDIYGQASSNSISLDDKINIFKDILESNDYSSLDVFVMSRQYVSKFFGSDGSAHLYVKGDQAISVIEIWTDDNNFKYLYKVNDSNINIADNIDNIIKGATKKG